MSALLLGLVLVGLLYQWAGTTRDAREFPPPGRLVDVGRGRRLHVQVQPAAPKPGAAYDEPGAACEEPGAAYEEPGAACVPAVVFDAGISASSLSWLIVAPRVAEVARVVTYDRSGLAWSERTHSPVSARSLAAELRVLLRAAGVEPPYILVGHSFGTFVVRAFTSEFPDDVAGMVLVDPIFPAEWLNMSPKDERRLRGGIFLSRVGAVLASVGFVRLLLNLLMRGSRTGPRSAARMFGSEAATLLTRLVLQVRKLPESAWPMMRAHWSRPRSFLAMADHLSSLRRSAVEIAAAKPIGDIPLVVLTAGLQPEAVRQEQARIAAQSPRGTQTVVSDAGHWILIDQPEAVIEAVKRVVKDATGLSPAAAP